tara:strand:- start:195 stop:890 length:696 start_codon:yes stop_codon:yes gene_type:complete
MNKVERPQKTILSEKHIQTIFKQIDEFQHTLETTTYKEELFKGFRNILIIGPQRSGTTFTSQALAKTLGYNNIDEDAFNVKNAVKCREIMERGNNVIQAPGLTHVAQFLADERDLVVFMVRKWSDIIKSVYKKNGFLSDWVIMNHMYNYNLYNYMHPHKTGLKVNVPEIEEYFNKYVDKNNYYLDVVYKIWDYYQKDKVKNWINLSYESMETHPMWLDKSKRKNFHSKQTK